jgi:hypothetical protein
LKIYLEETKDRKRKPKMSLLRTLRHKMGIRGKEGHSSSSSDEGPSTSKAKKQTKKRICRDLEIRVLTKIYVKWKLGGSMQVNKSEHPEVEAREDLIFQKHPRRMKFWKK